MVERVAKALKTAVANTLENMAFMEAVSTAATCDPADKETWAALDVLKPFGGRITLVMPDGLVDQILDGVFGPPDPFGGEDETERTFDAQQREDTVAEILNTLAGQFLSLLVPEDSTFSIAVPERGQGDPFGGEVCAIYGFESGGHVFRIAVEGEAFASR